MSLVLQGQRFYLVVIYSLAHGTNSSNRARKRWEAPGLKESKNTYLTDLVQAFPQTDHDRIRSGEMLACSRAEQVDIPLRTYLSTKIPAGGNYYTQAHANKNKIMKNLERLDSKIKPQREKQNKLNKSYGHH